MTIFIPWTSFDRDKDELELLNENATKEEIISSSSAIVLFTSAIHGRRKKEISRCHLTWVFRGVLLDDWSRAEESSIWNSTAREQVINVNELFYCDKRATQPQNRERYHMIRGKTMMMVMAVVTVSDDIEQRNKKAVCIPNGKRDP